MPDDELRVVSAGPGRWDLHSGGEHWGTIIRRPNGFVLTRLSPRRQWPASITLITACATARLSIIRKRLRSKPAVD